MKSIMNEQCQYYFEKGFAEEALLGEGAFFTPEITYRDDHDIGFVLGQFMDWAEIVHQEETAARIIEETLPLFFEKDDLVFAVRSIWCIFVSRKYGTGKNVPINMEKLGKVLLNFCIKHPDLINENQEICGLIQRICKHEPIIAKILGIDVSKLNIQEQPF